MKKILKKYNGEIFLVFISLLALVPRFIFADFISRDMKYCLLPWHLEFLQLDLKGALTAQVGNYNFLYQLIIYFLTKIPGDAIYKYKFLSGLFDYVLACGVFVFVREISGEKKAMIAYAVTLFLPTVWVNSCVWGQCDSIYSSLIVWSLFLLYKNKAGSSMCLLGLALAFKLQTVFILPFYAFYYIFGVINKQKRVRIYHFAIIPGTVLVSALPNIIAGRSVLDLVRVYLKQTETYKFISYNYPSVWNLWHLDFKEDLFWVLAFTCLILIILMVWFLKAGTLVTGKHFLWCAFILSYACVLFLPSMHERYGFLYEILAVVLAFSTGIGWIFVLMMQLISMRTYFYYLYQTPQNMELLSFLNLALFIFVLYAFIRELREKPLTISMFSREADADSQTFGFIRSGKLSICKNDIKAILFLMFAFIVIGSMHLGSTKAPSSTEIVGTDSENGTEVYVSLTNMQDVSFISIYSLKMQPAHAEIYYVSDGDWVKIDKPKINGCFRWINIPINAKTHEFCIIFSDPLVELGEIVCIDYSGNRIRLLDTCEPKGLFDEQDLVSVIPTGFESMIFDEIFHGRTAYEFLHGLAIYENTHPPLGKILMSIGIAIFGMNPFGYRIVVFSFGILCIPVIYLMVLRITGSSKYAMLAGLLQITEFMHYTLSRIATIDIIVAFFVICMFYGIVAFLQEERYRYLVFSGASFAFGAATKWTAVFAGAGVALILFVWMVNCIRKKRKASVISLFLLICVYSFIILPGIVYVLSYIPFAKVYPGKNILEHAISNSVYIMGYHTGIQLPHPYSSPWYSWIFDMLPLVDFRESVGGYKSVVSTFVNPLVCYLGLVCLFHNIYLAVKRKDISSAILVVFYLCMLAPWIFITRTVFIYQYFICTKILILLICRSIQCMSFKKENRVVHATAIASLALFIIYFPVISGVMVNKEYIDDVLKILPTWWF